MIPLGENKEGLLPGMRMPTTLYTMLSSAWFAQMDPYEQDLVQQALGLFIREKQEKSNFKDYAFIIFPLGKAYEAYLKDFLLKSGCITEEIFISRRFRIGKALNPNVSPRYRDEEWMYGKIVKVCGKETAELFWKAWIEGRNLIFHAFPDHRHAVSLDEAEERINLLSYAMDRAAQCILEKPKTARTI